MPFEGVIYAVDVGSPRRRLAWARLLDRAEAEPTHGADFAVLAREISADIQAARAVSWGSRRRALYRCHSRSVISATVARETVIVPGASTQGPTRRQ